MPSIEARNALINLARSYGMFVEVLDGDPDVFVTSPLLSTYCVRTTLEGLHDLCIRAKSVVDRRTATVRAGVAARHARTIDLMQIDRDLLRQQSLLYYDPRKRIVIDRRNPMLYREAMARANTRLNQAERRA